MQTKVCFKCQKRKPLGRFYAHPQMADGHLNKCKTCTKDDVKRRDPAALRAYELERKVRPERRASMKAYNQRRREAHPGKYRAGYAVSNAIRDGRLVRGPCNRCGSTERVQGHHRDYRKPLEVEWVCFKCHRYVVHGR